MKDPKNYRKGYLRIGIGIAAVLALGVLFWIGGTAYVDAGFPLREGISTTWWMMTILGFAIIGLMVFGIAGACLLGILLTHPNFITRLEALSQ